MDIANVGYFIIGAAMMTCVSHYHGKNPYLAMFSGLIWVAIAFFEYTQSTYSATGVFDVQYALFLGFVFFGIMELFETGRVTRKIIRDSSGKIVGTQEEIESDETIQDKEHSENAIERIDAKEKAIIDKYGRPIDKKDKLLG